MDKDFYLESIEFSLSTKNLSTYELLQNNYPFLKKIPMHLYKYRKSGDEGRIDFYVNKRNIYTSCLSEFHDSFEGVTPATKNRFKKFDARELCMFYKDTILCILKSHFPTIDSKLSNEIYDIFLEEDFDNEVVCNKFIEKIDDNDKKKFRTITSSLGYIFKKFDSELNSNTQFAQGIRTLLNINDEMGAFCMCDTYSNDNLWEFYADNFAGYCIEYDFSNPCKSRGSMRLITNLYPVNYVEEKDDDWFKALFEMTIKAIDKKGKANEFQGSLYFHQWMTKTLCSKKDIRSWEREWRVLGKANASYLGPLISCIIVGHNIKKNDFLNIEKYAKKHFYPLKITDVDYDNKEVIIRDLKQEDIDLIMTRDKK